MARTYATAEQFTARPDQAGAVVTPLELESASRRVELAVMGSVYAVDASGLPTDTDVQEALRDATLELVAWRRANGVQSGVMPKLKTASIGSASYTLQDTAAGGVDPDGLPQESATILRLAGLLNPTVLIYG